MLFTYRGSAEQKPDVAPDKDAAPANLATQARGAADLPVARLRIDVRVVDGAVVYDAAAELPGTLPSGMSRSDALLALHRAVASVGERTRGSREEVEKYDQDVVASKVQLLVEPTAPLIANPVELFPFVPPAPLAQEQRPVDTSSTLLSFVLLLGGACVFLGILALAVTRWSSVGHGGQLALIAAFTAATFATGSVLARRGYARSGFTLELLALELLWAVGYIALGEGGDVASDGWGAVAFFIAVAHAGFAMWRRSTAVAVSSCFALIASASLVGSAHATHSPTGAAAFAGVLGLVLGGIAYVADRFDHPALSRPYGTAAALLGLGGALGMTALLSDKTLETATTCLAVAWPYSTLGAALLLLRGRARKMSGATVAAITCAMLLPSVQALLLGLAGSQYWIPAVTLAPLSLALACACARFLSRERSAPAFFASLATVGWLMLSAGGATASYLSDRGELAALWPFVVAAFAWSASRLASRIEGARASVSRPLAALATAILMFVPSIEILGATAGDSPNWMRGAVLLFVPGLVVLIVDRLVDRQARGWAFPFALVPALWAVVTSGAALAELHRHPKLLAAFWPFATALLLGAAAFALRKEAASAGAVVVPERRSLSARLLAITSAVLLLVAPSLEALAVNWGACPWWLRGAAALFGTALGAAIVWRATTRFDEALAVVPVKPKSIIGLFAGVALLWILALTRVALREVELQQGYISVAVAWPYLMALGVLGIGALVDETRRPARVFRLAALAIATTSATWMALIASDRVGFVVVAVAMGLGATLMATRPKKVESSDLVGLSNEPSAFLGVATATVAPALLCLVACFNQPLVGDPSKHLGMASFGYFALFLVSLTALLGIVETSGALAPRALRGIELALGITFFAVVGLLSLPDLQHDVVYMTTLFAGGAAMVAIGLAKHRVVLVGLSSVALVLELFVQYFAKLHGQVHWGLLALGFGVGLLGLAVLYERKVKPLLPELARWS